MTHEAFYPTCESCSRAEPLWFQCTLLPRDCPQRGVVPVTCIISVTRIISVTEPGYDVALFFDSDGGAEAVITRPGDKQPIGVNIAPPAPGRQIVVERHGDCFEVMYRSKP